MDLKSYLLILKANIWIILVTLITTLAVVVMITLKISPVYTSTTILRVAATTGAAINAEYNYAERLLNTFVNLATSTPILDELVKQLSLSQYPDIKVEVIPNTELIKVTANSQDPTVAQNVARTMAELLIAKSKEFYTGGAISSLDILGEQLAQSLSEVNKAQQEYELFVTQNPLNITQAAVLNRALQLSQSNYASLLDQYQQAQVKELMRSNIVTVIEPATLPVNPSKPNKVLNLGIGFMLGLVGGIGLAFLTENLSGQRIFSSTHIQSVTGLGTLGKIPNLKSRIWTRFLRHKDDDSYFSPINESFRNLEAHLMMQIDRNGDDGIAKTFLVTSAEPGEGKSIISSHLAKSITQFGKKVIVVDCNFYNPEQHKIYGLPNNIGLSTVLTQNVKCESAIAKTSNHEMDVLTSGPSLTESAKTLGSSQMVSIIKDLSQMYNVVLLDAPAFLVVSDAERLVPCVDGVVLVVRRNFSREDKLVEVCNKLTDIHANILGVVVNFAENNGFYRYRHD